METWETHSACTKLIISATVGAPPELVAAAIGPLDRVEEVLVGDEGISYSKFKNKKVGGICWYLRSGAPDTLYNGRSEGHCIGSNTGSCIICLFLPPTSKPDLSRLAILPRLRNMATL